MFYLFKVILSHFHPRPNLSHSPYPSGNKSSLDACPPFLPSRESNVGTGL
jgi:hypothetical protein